MLTFFRRIRKGLIKGNETSKYLLYAIGEITLVVVRILIALQINNWNENRKATEEVSMYLSNIIESINTDAKTLKGVARQSEIRYNTLHHLLTITRNQVYDFNPLARDFSTIVNEPMDSQNQSEPKFNIQYPVTFNDKFLTLCINNSVFVNAINIKSDVFEEMKSTGIFSRIEDVQLKKAINGYYNFFEQYFVKPDWNRDLTRSWRYFIRDNYNVVANGNQVIGNPSTILEDPQSISRIQEMVGPARWRAQNAYQMIKQGQKITELSVRYTDSLKQ